MPDGVPLLSAPALEFIRRIYAKLPRSLADADRFDPWLAERFSRYVAGKLPDDIDVLIAWSGGAKELMRCAHKRNIKVMLERGSTHIAHQAEVLNDAYRMFGIEKPAVPPRMIERETEEYEGADAISVPTHYAAGTFIERGVARDKIKINPYGVALERFLLAKDGGRKRNDGPVRILFVGQVGIRKGIPWLLRAFQSLKQAAELHLIGPVPKEMEEILGREPLENVTIHGSVPGEALPEIYKSADIFCLPSLEEGFALVLLQAMAAGLPVVASNVSGAEDLIASGEQGYLVPPCDSDALMEALAALIDRPEARAAMGIAARSRVERGYSWQDYGERAVSAVRQVLGH
ncbi:MAG: glycosyltransferase family 4 protein [Rhodospirillales bacterium]